MRLILAIGRAVPVLIVILHAEHCPRESQNLAEGYKDRIMDFAGGRHTKSGNEQTAANDNQEDGGKQLNSWFVFANFRIKCELNCCVCGELFVTLR